MKLLNDWTNEFGRGVRQQSVRSSFTKDKAGTLPFYMYMSVNSDKDVDEQSEMAMHELFKPFSSTEEGDTPGTSNFQAPPPNQGSSAREETGQVLQSPHSGIYAIQSRSNDFSLLISEKIQGGAIVGTEYVLKDDSSFVLKRSGDVTSRKHSNIICKTDREQI